MVAATCAGQTLPGRREEGYCCENGELGGVWEAPWDETPGEQTRETGRRKQCAHGATAATLGLRGKMESPESRERSGEEEGRRVGE